MLLTLRSPESWWESYSKTILTHVERLKGTGSWVDVMIGGKVMSGQPQDRATAMAAFNANTETLRALVPHDRLIVHEVGDGWGPLCEGLDLPILDTPYPVTNSPQEFLARHAARIAATQDKAWPRAPLLTGPRLPAILDANKHRGTQ